MTSDTGANMWLATVVLLASLSRGWSDCFFPFEYHGTYAVQRAPNEYSEVMIEINKMLPYGACHTRVDNNLILQDMSNGCLRCFHLAIRSANVLQLHTRDPQSSCATHIDSTLKLCPTVEEMSSLRTTANSTVHELMLYKVRSPTNEEHKHPVYCPISGRFSFSYDIDDGTESVTECANSDSQISNCPLGFGLHLNFNGCSFRPNLNMTFECLGDWRDSSGNSFVALLDTGAADDKRPRYRCAMYRKEASTGRIYVALSSDSSCHRHLESATRGYERLVLQPADTRPWPLAVRQATCTLPDWAQGVWQHSHVDGDTMVYKDAKNFKTHTTRCVAQHDQEKFVIYSRSQCGEESYKCIWLKYRGTNVMEFQIGSSPSDKADDDLCADHWFLETDWITQGKEKPMEESPCPVSGEYQGVIPDTDDQLGAKLYSDCSSPGIMFYSVLSRGNHSHIYEEREYRCLGTWHEGDVMYTYTQRRDVLLYECFAGRVMADGRVFIGEAGTDESCRRRIDPTRTGMLIDQIAPCYSTEETGGEPRKSSIPPPLPVPTQTADTTPELPRRRPDRPASTDRPPWDPITARPGDEDDSGAGGSGGGGGSGAGGLQGLPAALLAGSVLVVALLRL
ncbi:uncharacterized protein LOC122383317 [Amphibalanus amphitrite]|uniref:uncharacterized protein LOC122383317 n=1 Tax=Amphibalanus amphitrite TaxID=1232801 RepID=UPI001C92448D|nr:uncharacterized protein LOC122383317 [Amphibalanus amphitrite]